MPRLGLGLGLGMPSVGGAAVIPFEGADLVLDFANSFYRQGATEGATPASIGATVNGTATIGASGLLCDASGESVSLAYSIASGAPFCVVVDYEAQTSTALAATFEFTNGGSPNLLGLYKLSANTSSQSSGTLSTAYAASGKVATGFRTGFHYVSFGGASTLTRAQTLPNFSAGTKTIGNLTAGFNPALVNIRSVAIYLGEFNDAAVQAFCS